MADDININELQSTAPSYDESSGINISELSSVSTNDGTGSTGDVNLYQYDPSRYDIGGIYAHELPNLEDIRARNQGVLDALGRSTVNLVGKTGINVIGGTLGTIYGAGSAIANGEISKLWDNSLTSVLDSASEAIGDTFKVYKSADYEERSLLGRLFTHPIQFTDEFMDTLSFTTGAVVTELLTAGLASATIAPRALKYLKGLDRGAEAMDAANAMRTAGAVSKLGTAGTLTRQLATGAAWEASVEARHGAIDLKESMYNDALQEFGVEDISQLPENVVEDIEDRASNAGLFTFLTNMALVGGSNIVQFPKIFGAGFNTSKRAGNRIARGAGQYVDNALPTTRADRFIRNVGTALRNPFMEGVVEEGGQSVLSQTAAMYWDRKNDDEAKSEVDRFLHSFGTALKDTYTTGEGWYEIGMGMLIGSLGAPGRGLMPGSRGIDPETGQRRELWTGGIAGSFQERAAEDAEVSQLVERLNNSPELMNSMKANYDFLTTAASIQPAQDRALDRDDTFMFENYRDDMLHAWIDSRMQAGLSSDLDTQVEDLKKIDTEDFYVSFRGEEQADKASTQDKVLFKQRMIQNLESQIDNTREAYNVVDNNYQGTNEDLRQELIYNVASAKNLDIREQNINRAVSDLTSGAINDLNLRVADERISVNAYIKLLQDSLKSEEITDTEVEEINNTLETLNNIEDKKKTYSIDELNLINSFTASRPVEASLNTNKVLELMEDSRKLRQRRQSFIDIYNKLFTREGQEQFEKMQQDIAKAEEKAAETARLKAETEERNKQVKKERADVKKKAAKQKEEPVAEDDMPVLTEGTQDDEVTTPQIEPSEEVSPEESIVEPPVEESSSKEAKRADIERRRQEEIGTKEQRSYTDDNGVTWTVQLQETNEGKVTRVRGEKDGEIIEQYENRYSKELSNEKIYEVENVDEYQYTEIESVEVKGKKADKINAKYDAELAALTETEPTQTLEERAEEIWRNDVNDRGLPNRALSEVIDELRQQEAEEQSLLTPEEQATLTSIDADEVYDTNKILADDGLVKLSNQNLKEAHKIFSSPYENDHVFNIDVRQRAVGNVITSLTIDYGEEVTENEEGDKSSYKLRDVLDEQGNLKINPNFDSRLQDPDQFNRGSTSNIIFPTYQQMQERGIGGQGYTQEQYNEDVKNPNMIPIAFVDDSGKIIGYLPTTQGVMRNVDPSVMEEELDKNIKLREFLANNPDTKYRFEITDKSTGTPMFSQNRGSIYNKLGDGNRLGEGVKVAVFKAGTLLQGENSPVNNPIKLPARVHPEDYFEEGVVYTVIPTADGVHSFAIPADVSNVSQESADTILKMLDLFVGTSDTIKAERDRLAAETDFSDIKQLTDAIGNIIYVNNDTDNHRFQIDLKNRKLKLGAAKDKIFNLSDLNKSETRDKIANEIKKKYYAVKTANMNKPYTQFKVNEGKLDVIPHNDYNDYLNSESIITTNLQSEPIEGTDKRYYTAQSVITISEPIIAQEKEAPLVTEVTESRETPVKKTYTNPLGAKSRKKKNRPDTFEDFDGIVTPNASIDQQAEEMMRKCRK